jgi:hypothetical protein
VTFKPCIYCPFSPDCDIRREKVSAVRGLGITTMTFKCQKLLDTFQPGDVITTSLYFNVPSYMDYETVHRDVTGTVMRWKGTNNLLVAFSPQAGTSKPLGNLRPKHCRKTGECRRVCIHCGKPEGIELKSPDPVDGLIPWVCRYEDGDWNTPLAALPCEYEAQHGE